MIKGIQPIRKTSRYPTRIRRWYQFSKFGLPFTKVIPFESEPKGYTKTATDRQTVLHSHLCSLSKVASGSTNPDIFTFCSSYGLFTVVFAYSK